MTNTVFDYLDYQKYVNAFVRRQPMNGRGAKSAIAAAIDCQVSYVSRVLSGETHFSLEQAENLNAYFSHSTHESDFFILLVQYARAGTERLKTRIQNQIDEILRRRQLIKERLQIEDGLTPENQGRYYSDWYYAAIHMLVSIERFQSRDALGKTLNLDPAKVDEALDFLCRCGLVHRRADGSFEIGLQQIHLAAESPLVNRHHSNWRMRSIVSLDQPRPEDLHYSVLVGISKKDAETLKFLILKTISEFMGVAHRSEQEAVHGFNIDFFRI